MPIEVKELIVKAVVSDSKAPDTSSPEAATSLSTKKIISLCVEEVLRILEREKER